jgi:hypothetical protein
MVLRWKDTPEIEGFCHDNDVKAMSVISDELQWMIIEKFDQNHVLKKYNSAFNQYKFIESRPLGENLKTGNGSVTVRERSATTKPKRKECTSTPSEKPILATRR